ncbi:hypothetical protein F4861DRAFT_51739 [Xylaria intraflava]|nr:hypothetical protein F4861DRAFT_51739 [Xylaria intraflava]
MPQNHSPSRDPSTSAPESAGRDSNGVLSRVLGSLRRSPQQDDAGKDTNWIHNFKITHRPDRPRRDMREALRRRDSATLMTELYKIWHDNERKRAEKARAAAAATTTGSAGSSSSHPQRRRRDEHSRRDPSRGRTSAPSDSESENDRRRPANEGMVTIRIGMSLNRRELESKHLNTKPRTGNPVFSYAVNDSSVSTPTPPAKSRSAPPFPPSAHREATRRRHKHTLSRSPAQRSPARPTAAHPSSTRQQPSTTRSRSSTRARALRESMTSLYIDADQEISPGFVPNPLPGSKRVPKICPLCRNPLRTAADKKQNLCGECRGEHQPRQSTFADSKSPAASNSSSYTSLVSEYHYDSTAGVEVAEAKVKTLRGTVVTSINHCGSDQSVDKIRLTEIPPVSQRRTRIKNNVVSDYPGKIRAEFKLQAVPADRKRARRVQKSRQDGGNSVNGGDHTGVQPGTPNPAPAPQLPLRREPDSSAKRASGPILLPMTFCPEAPRAKQNGKSPITRSSSRARVAKPGAHRTNTPMPRSPMQSRKRSQPATHHAKPGASRSGADGGAGPTNNHPSVLKIDKKFSREAAGGAIAPKVDIDKICRDTNREIDSIIECYRQLPNGTFGRVNEKREGRNERLGVDFVGSYHMQTSYDLEIRDRGFI